MNDLERVKGKEIQELLKKAEETRLLIQDAENLLDAVLEDLEEAYAEVDETEQV